MWGYPSLSPAWGASQPSAHMPQFSFPSPKASQCGRAPESHPSLHKVLTPLSSRAPCREAVLTTLHCRAVAILVTLKAPTEVLGQLPPPPSSTSTCQAFLLCLPSGTNTDGCRHKAPPHRQLQEPPDRAATVSSSWNPRSKAAGLGTGLEPLLSKILSYWVVGNRGGRAGGTGNVSQGAWFLPPWQKESQGKRSWSRSTGHMQDPHPGTDDPPPSRGPPRRA